MVWLAVYVVCGLLWVFGSGSLTVAGAEREFRRHRLTCPDCAAIEEGSAAWRWHVLRMLAYAGAIQTLIWPIPLTYWTVRRIFG